VGRGLPEVLCGRASPAGDCGGSRRPGRAPAVV